jgi:hypothetical protein
MAPRAGLNGRVSYVRKTRSITYTLGIRALPMGTEATYGELAIRSGQCVTPELPVIAS